MKIIGLIMEANPYHNGHQYLVNQVIERFPGATIICVTSGSFTMRGEISLINKFDKTNYLLQGGINLVLELPIVKTLQNADYFGKYTVEILKTMGITDLVVGAENPDEAKLAELSALIQTPSFSEAFKNNLDLKLSYKNTFTKTLEDLDINADDINLFNQPNYTLAVQYKIALQGSDIALHLIKRTNSYHGLTAHDSIASANTIRTLFENNQAVDAYLPFPEKLIDLKSAKQNLLSFINYRLVVNQKDFENTMGVSEGIHNYILQKGDFSDNYTALTNSLKNRRYTINRISRALLSYVLDINKDINHQSPYLRILGFDKLGELLLRKLSPEIKQQIFSGYNELANKTNPASEIAMHELRATKIYGLITNNPLLYLEEYKLPIRKKENEDVKY